MFPLKSSGLEKPSQLPANEMNSKEIKGQTRNFRQTFYRKIEADLRNPQPGCRIAAMSTPGATNSGKLTDVRLR